jgi:hypothetical protein
MQSLSNEEIAARIVGIYFKEVARLGFKRSLTLEETMNSYYYVLSKLGNPKECIEAVKNKVVVDEKLLASKTKEEAIPSVTETVTTTERTEKTEIR